MAKLLQGYDGTWYNVSRMDRLLRDDSERRIWIDMSGETYVLAEFPDIELMDAMIQRCAAAISDDARRAVSYVEWTTAAPSTRDY